MSIATPGALTVIMLAASAIFCLIVLWLYLHHVLQHSESNRETTIRELTDSLSDGAFILKNDHFIYVNPSLCAVLDYSIKDFKRMKWQDITTVENSGNAAQLLKELREGKRREFQAKLTGVRRDGSKILLNVTAKRVSSSGGGKLYAGTIRVASEPSAPSDQPGTDPMTGLPGRLRLRHDMLHEILDGGAVSFALILVDVDGLTRVNDTLGHEAGNQLLILAAKRLAACERDHVYHFQGDTFAILLKDISRAEAERHMKRISEEFTGPLSLNQSPWYESVTMGISFFPDDADNRSQMIEHAEAAIHYAKKVSKGKYQIFNPAIGRKMKKQLELEMDLRRALSRDQLVMYYQPQIDLRSGTMQGNEALMRWVHPNLGVISPSVFIPLAEQIGIIEEIGEWALETACRQTKIWNELGFDFRLSVNLSPKQVLQDNLADLVRQTLRKTHFPPQLLHLEITETADADLLMMARKLGELRDLGTGISIDDFGTGYNSLNYLKALPLTQMKIDQSFIRKDYYNQHNTALIRTIIALAEELKLQVVAEGVETAEHVRFLKQLHCDLAQGYLFGRPLPAASLLSQIPLINRQITLASLDA
ncbi:sensor domain-containing protein [Sporolactobacillus vineae]|uniref:sensor domain-containing protein n=1 Tax=Sporolactobacillus vineae TaxID=444463 RepID=UPI001313F953|nr:bifunctional diguanylate cyclase/phosphodiesterase [Sporolactobacillus vineae]